MRRCIPTRATQKASADGVAGPAVGGADYDLLLRKTGRKAEAKALDRSIRTLLDQHHPENRATVTVDVADVIRERYNLSRRMCAGRMISGRLKVSVSSGRSTKNNQDERTYA
jgi:ATP phosphoribosyltransferase regulatory subunit HisZ